MKLCPYCQQDVVWRVRLKTSQEWQFSMCFECDSLWLDDQPVLNQVGTTFDKYAESLGLVPDWGRLEKLGVVE